MKNIFSAFFLVILMATPSFALFTNGGFETGDITGWTFVIGSRDHSSTNITWETPIYTLNSKSKVITNATPLQTGQSLNVDVYDGNYMLRLNNYVMGSSAAKIYQTDYIDAQDIADGAMLYVKWGAMLADPSNHKTYEQPYFKIIIAVGSDSSEFDAYGNENSGWTLAGKNYDADLYYKSDTWSYDLSSYGVGTAVTIEMLVSNCALGGHGSWAYLDGIEIVPPTQHPVPIPGAIWLLGSGLIGLAGTRRKFKN
jgi:hypothetical protein